MNLYTLDIQFLYVRLFAAELFSIVIFPDVRRLLLLEERTLLVGKGLDRILKESSGVKIPLPSH